MHEWRCWWWCQRYNNAYVLIICFAYLYFVHRPPIQQTNPHYPPNFIYIWRKNSLIAHIQHIHPQKCWVKICIHFSLHTIIFCLYFFFFSHIYMYGMDAICGCNNKKENIGKSAWWWRSYHCVESCDDSKNIKTRGWYGWLYGCEPVVRGGGDLFVFIFLDASLVTHSTRFKRAPHQTMIYSCFSCCTTFSL